MYFWRFVGILGLAVLLLAPVVRSHTQEFSIVQDLNSIQLDYGILGQKAYRKKLDDLVHRHRLDPRDVEIKVEENRRESTFRVEMRYNSSMSFFFNWTRAVLIDQEFILRPVE